MRGMPSTCSCPHEGHLGHVPARLLLAGAMQRHGEPRFVGPDCTDSPGGLGLGPAKAAGRQGGCDAHRPVCLEVGGTWDSIAPVGRPQHPAHAGSTLRPAGEAGWTVSRMPVATVVAARGPAQEATVTEGVKPQQLAGPSGRFQSLVVHC